MLFDSSGMHSFVSCAFIWHVDKNTKPLECYRSIKTPKGDSIAVNRVYKSCPTSFGDREFIVDLLPILMQDLMLFCYIFSFRDLKHLLLDIILMV